MATAILMPALSPTMTEGKLAQWLKAEGDVVAAGDVLAEIEPDKATMEVEAVDEGVLAKIVVPGGTEGVAVNAVIAVLADEGEAAAGVDVAALSTMPSPAPIAANRGWRSGRFPCAPIAPTRAAGSRSARCRRSR